MKYLNYITSHDDIDTVEKNWVNVIRCDTENHVHYNRALNYITDGLQLFLDAKLNQGEYHDDNPSYWIDRAQDLSFSVSPDVSSVDRNKYDWYDDYITSNGYTYSSEPPYFRTTAWYPNFSNGNFTLIMVYEGANMTTNRTDYIMGTAGGNFGSNNRWQLTYDAGTINLFHNNGSWVKEFSTELPSTIRNVVIITKSGNNISSYINGELMDTGTSTKTYAGTDGFCVRITNWASHCYMVYDRALSLSEIETMTDWAIEYYELDRPFNYIQDGLILRLDGIQNTRSGHVDTISTWEDLSGNNRDLTVTGPYDNPSSISEMYPNSDSMSFYDDEFTFKINDSVLTQFANVNVNGTLEIVCSNSDLSKVGCVISLMSTPYYQGKGLWFRPSSSQIVLSLSQAGNAGTAVGIPTINDQGIHSYSINYLNGSNSNPVSSAYIDNVAQTISTTAGTMAQAASLSVGGRWANSTEYGFVGNIYSVRLYNRVLTDQERYINYLTDIERFSAGDPN